MGNGNAHSPKTKGESSLTKQDQLTAYPKPHTGLTFRCRAVRDLKMNFWVYLMAVPVLAYYIIFCYVPMYGALMAFQNYRPGAGIWGSEWVGLKHFISFFQSPDAFQLIRNTFLISLYSLLWGFPAPIILALLINEVGNKGFKRVVQSITYLPHFISTVIIVSIIRDMVSTEGIINQIVALLGGTPTNLLLKPEYFRTIYIASGIWTGVGWGSIIYLAALTNVDPTLYEAARIDGAGRWKQTIHITLPSIVPTIIIMLILNVGSLMSVGFEKVMLMYNPLTYDVADVIGTYVYRRGLEMADYSFSTAVGLFNSVVNFVLIVSANWIARKCSDISLW